MPFTPFHFGPGLGLGLPLRRRLHAPTFILANVIVDLEPFLVVFLGLNYPLHGYLHTFLLAIPVGLVFGCAMRLLEKPLLPLYKSFLLETGGRLSLRSFIAAGVLGTGLHILLDSPLYGDIKPFYPVTANPFYDPALAPGTYGLCVWMGAFGIIFYLGLIIRKLKKKQDSY